MVYAIKIARESQIAFAVEAVAASQVRDVAQQVRHWQGRVFLPLLHGVGLGRIADTSPHRVMQKPAMLVMELADGTLQCKKFEGEALMMLAWALASTPGFTEFLGLHSWRPETFKCFVASVQQCYGRADASRPRWLALANRLRQCPNI